MEKSRMGFEKTRTVHFDWHNERPEAFGYKFKSKAELNWATYLELLKGSMNNPDLIEWSYEPRKFKSRRLWWNKWRFYTPDFLAVWTDTPSLAKQQDTYEEWHEVKTSLRQKDVTRFQWFRADYPEIRIVLVLTSKPTRRIKQKRLLGNVRKYVDDVVFAGPIIRQIERSV